MADQAPPRNDGDDRETSESLLEKARDRGDTAAWSQLVTIYSPYVRGKCKQKHYIPDQDIDDLVQDVLMAAFTSLGTYVHRGPGTFRAWLKTIISRRVFHYRNTRQSTPSAQGGTDAYANLQQHPDSLSSNDEDSPSEVAAIARACLAYVREKCNENHVNVFLLLMEDKTGAQIAEALSMSPGAVYTAIARVRKALRDEGFEDLL